MPDAAGGRGFDGHLVAVNRYQGTGQASPPANAGANALFQSLHEGLQLSQFDGTFGAHGIDGAADQPQADFTGNPGEIRRIEDQNPPSPVPR